MHFPSQSTRRITVNRFALQETGTYNPLHFRPYQTHIDPISMDTVVQRAESAIGNIINPNIFSGIGCSIVTPSGTPGQQISIPYGWSERRIRFILEIIVENSLHGVELFYFQGYTNYLGVSNSGYIDPNMTFIINSYLRVSRSEMYTANGLQYIDRVTDSGQVIDGRMMTDNPGNVYPGMEYGVYTMRPQDVFLGVSSTHTAEQYAQYGKGPINDTRVVKKTESEISSRTNNVPTNYITKILGSYQTAADSQMYGNDTRNVINRAQEISFEHDSRIRENPFLRALSNIRGGGPNSTHAVFTISELQSIDPQVGQKTNYINLNQTAKASLPSQGVGAYWNSADRETLIATILSTSVPGLMMECMISNIYLTTTNNTIDGKFLSTFIDSKSFTNVDMTRFYAAFLNKLENQLLFDMTYGSQELVNIAMKIDIMGESVINVSVNNGPQIMYQTPSFADALMTPVATVDKNNYYGICNDFDMIFNNMSAAVPDLTNIAQGI